MKNSETQYGLDSVVFSLIGKFGYSQFLTDTAHSKHEIAVNNLMTHVGFIEKIRLRRRWRRLAMLKVGKGKYIPYYEQYQDFGSGSLVKRRKVRPIAVKRIQDIISFANK